MCVLATVQAQYILIHQALLEHNQFGETEIPLSELHSTLGTLRSKVAPSVGTLMDDEYEVLFPTVYWVSGALHAGVGALSCPCVFCPSSHCRRDKNNTTTSLCRTNQRLPTYKNWRTHNTGSTEENKDKNRCSSVLPCEYQHWTGTNHVPHCASSPRAFRFVSTCRLSRRLQPSFHQAG